LILVTGGAGFIGSHLVAALSAAGLEVVVLDDFSGVSASNVPAGVRVVEADVSDPAVVDVIGGLAPRAVFHAAAQVSVALSAADPVRDRAVNVEGTENVISGSLAAGAGRLVFLSSGGAVYGDSDGASERTLPAPASYYGAHKYLAERYVELSGLSFAIARLANVYGPGQRSDLEGGVVSIFLERLLAGEPITVNGTGEQSRDFVYVEDVVQALMTMLHHHTEGTWNVGTGVSTSVAGLLEGLQLELGTNAAPFHAPPRAGDVRSSRFDVDLIDRDLGWTSGYSLTDGLRRMIGAPVQDPGKASSRSYS
jgi:UDP-glucose 4-epimerase